MKKILRLWPSSCDVTASIERQCLDGCNKVFRATTRDTSLKLSVYIRLKHRQIDGIRHCLHASVIGVK